MSGFVHVKRIGRGNYGTAHLVRTRGSGNTKHLVVKKIPLTMLNEAERESARSEIEVLKQLQHHHIVRHGELSVEHRISIYFHNFNVNTLNSNYY